MPIHRRHTLRLWSFLALSLLILPLTSGLSAQETDQNSPVGAVGGAVHADLFTGTATTSIPIQVPPGRGGVQPDLALVYGSSNGNGWLGMGWKLEKGVIERQTKFGVDYNGDDYVFRLSGINVELLNTASNEYRAKIEGEFTRVEKLPSATDGKPFFKATDTAGKVYIFGTEAATRVTDENDPDKIFRWCLERVEDVHGNYMTLSYTYDQGQAYLSQIDYTGHGTTTPPTNQIIFHLEDRLDDAPMYVPNFKMTTAKRLKTIEVKANGNLVRAYALIYTTSSDTSRSLLSNIRQYGENAVINGSGVVTGGSFLPEVNIAWPSFPQNFDGAAIWEISSEDPLQDGYFYATDASGDGRTDLVYLNGSHDWRVLESTGTGFQSLATWGSHDGDGRGVEFFRSVDVTGDGKSDILYLSDTGWKVLVSTGTGFQSGVVWQSQNQGDIHHSAFLRVGDFDGDGKADLVYWSSSGDWKVLLSTGSSFQPATAWQTYPGDAAGSEYVYARDVNADGKTDLLYLSDGQDAWRVLLSTGSGFQTATNWQSQDRLDIAHSGYVSVADYNGDGKPDISYLSSAHEWKVLVNTGSSFLPTAVWQTHPDDAAGTQYFSAADVNGDGKSDLVYLADNNGGWKVLLSTGAEFLEGLKWKSGNAGEIHNFNRLRMTDMTGDGKSDIMYLGSSNTWRVMRSDANSPLLASIANGIGGSTTIEYTPSTDYTNTQLPFPIQTVSKITTGDGNGTSAVTTYEYEGGFHHIGERDSRGFHKVTVTGPAGPSGEQTITETWFHQGNDHLPGSNDPNVADGYLKGAPYQVEIKDGQNNVYSRTTTTYLDDTDGAPFFSPPVSMVTDICDGTGCSKQTQTDFTYDLYGNVTREDQHGDVGDGSDDRTIVRTYDPNTTDWILGLPKSEAIYDGIGTSTLLAQTSFYYDGVTGCNQASTNTHPIKGQLTRTVKWLSNGTDPETRMAYNSQGNLTCTRDAKGHETNMAYDNSGTFVTSTTSALNHTTTTQFYGVNGVAMDTGLYGQVKQVTDPNGVVVSTEYDVFGRRTTVTQPGLVTTTTYNNFGTVGSQHVRTDSLGLSTWTYFDGLGRTIEQKSTGTDSRIIVSKTEYDERGAVTRSSTPYFETGGSPLWSINTYDTLGRVVRTDNPDGSRGLACFDDWVTVTIDANNHRKRITRDAYGRVATVQEYEGTYPNGCNTNVGSPYSATTYEYDELGNLTSLTDTLGNQSTMTYDTLSRKVSMTDPDMGTWLYEYDANGNLAKQTDARNQVIRFQYDPLNRRTQKDYGDDGNVEVSYTYDGSTHNRKGRLQKVDDESGSTTFYYDQMGRVTRTDKVVDNHTYTTETTYDGLGRPLMLTYPDNSGTITHVYDGPQLEQVQEGGTTYALYENFNALGQPGRITYGNGVTTDYTYDSQNFRLKTLMTKKGTTVLQDLGYTFDPGGNVEQLTDITHGTQDFTYDDLDRLKTATNSSYGTIAYSYNAIGNMTNNSKVGAYNYPSNGSARPHAVTNAGGQSYGYDNNGNMINGASRTITYDFENRPTSITKDGKTTTFVYDGDGGRVKKIVTDGGIDYETIYIGKLFVCDDSTQAISCARMIFAGGQRIAMKQDDGTVDYFHPDHLGSTSVVTKSTGTPDQQLSYFPFGETRSNTGETSGASVDNWALKIGSSPGGNDLFEDSGLGQQTSATVSNLPTDGTDVYVSLSYTIGAETFHDDYVYTASEGGGTTGPPAMSNPPENSTLTGTTQTFTWVPNSSTVTDWWLYVGTTGKESKDIFNSGALGNTLSANVSGLPEDGSTIYVRLWYKVSGTWLFTDYEYTASNGSTTTYPLTITKTGSGSGTVTSTPAGINCGSTCTTSYADNSSIDLTATAASGSTVANWNGGGCSGTGSTCTVTLTQAETVTVTFDASTTGPPAMSNPPDNATLVGTTQLFTWAPNSSTVTDWWLYVGTTGKESKDIFNSGALGTALSATVSGIPENGNTVYVRLWYKVAGTWLSTDYEYTASNGSTTTYPLTITKTGTGSGTVTSTDGGINCGSTCTTSYAENTSIDLLAAAASGSTIANWNGGGCSGTGSTCTVTLTQAQTVTVTFDASTTGPPAMSNPPDNATLAGTTQIFTWTANGMAVEEWWLEVGTTHGETDIHNSGFIGTATSHTVPGLPTDGSLICVRLWYRIGTSWTKLDSTYTASGGGSAMNLSNPPHILLAKMRNNQRSEPAAGATYRSHRALHTLGVESPTSRQGGGIFSLRFGIPQLEPQSVNPLVHLVTHGGSPSTTITPAPQSVLTGATVTFSWGHVGGTNVPYRYTGKEQDDSTGLYFYEARYYDPVLRRFISADTIVPSVTDPQSLNRYSYARNNPVLYNDPSGHFFKKAGRSIKNRISKDGDFLWKYRHYGTAGTTVLLDYQLNSSPYVRWAIGAAGSSVLSGYGYGAVFSAGFTAYTAKLDGSSSWDALKAGVIAGATSAAFQGVDYYTGGNNYAAILGHGAVGGTSAELQGGSFINGFAISAGTKSLSVAAYHMRESVKAQSKLNPQNSSGISAGFGGDSFKTGGGRCVMNVDCATQDPSWLGGIQGREGEIFEIPYSPYSPMDYFIEAFGGPHDYLNSWYWYDPATGNAYNYQGMDKVYGEILNGINVPLAAPFAAASATTSSAYIGLLGK